MLEPRIGTGVVELSMGMKPRDVLTYLGYPYTMTWEVSHASTAVKDVRIITSH